MQSGCWTASARTQIIRPSTTRADFLRESATTCHHRDVIKTLLLSMALLALCVPWWFAGSDSGPILFGLPGWALFALGATFLYAIAVCYLLGTEWDKHGGNEPDDESN